MAVRCAAGEDPGGGSSGERHPFFGGICDGTKTQLIYGSRSLDQVLGAIAGLIEQMSSACGVPKEEILQTLQLLLTDRQYH